MLSRATRKRFARVSRVFLSGQILPIEVPQKKGEPIVIKYDESPREDTSLEALGKIEAGVQERWNGDRGKRSGHERWRGGVGRHQRTKRVAAWQDADRANRGAGRQRRGAEMGDDGAGRRGGKTAHQDRLGSRQGCRPRRIERSLRGRGDRRHAASCGSIPRK